jgi:hypothetical protein
LKSLSTLTTSSSLEENQLQALFTVAVEKMQNTSMMELIMRLLNVVGRFIDITLRNSIQKIV